MKELLDELTNKFIDEKTRRLNEWPTKPNVLSNKLRRLAPVLRQGGVGVTFGKHTRAGTLVVLERLGKSPSPPSPESALAHAGDGRDDGDDSYPAGLEVFDQ